MDTLFCFETITQAIVGCSPFSKQWRRPQLEESLTVLLPSECSQCLCQKARQMSRTGRSAWFPLKNKFGIETVGGKPLKGFMTVVSKLVLDYGEWPASLPTLQNAINHIPSTQRNETPPNMSTTDLDARPNEFTFCRSRKQKGYRGYRTG